MKLSHLLVLTILSLSFMLPYVANAQQQKDTTKKANLNEIPASFRGDIDGWRSI